ncbi:SDR family oxidoreductase [Zeimonas sediminis]|uniref:SDR family oxidoreductase n=1 Tax=Zeimonas sediminis TaxID=2944268 RepID=UPI002342F1C8|nr:SDR family oxidoreductase [Zeimonas sediminis]
MTAAAQGMGRASALAMAREGARVVATDLREDLLKALADEARAEGLSIVVARLDVTDDAAVARMIGELPPLDVLFNCAGYVHQGTIFECEDADWDRSFAINVRAMYKTIKAALPKMLENGGGSIVNMASVCSSLRGLPNRFAYGASKAAVVGLTKQVAADFVAKGVRCNCIAPGTVETPSLHDRMRQLGDVDEARKMFVARQPMGRIATAEEIIPIVVYLASDESAFMTGQCVAVDGGMTI